jgi:hypothetical protein
VARRLAHTDIYDDLPLYCECLTRVTEAKAAKVTANATSCDRNCLNYGMIKGNALNPVS